MNNDAAEKKIRLYEADRALRNTRKFRDILSYILLKNSIQVFLALGYKKRAKLRVLLNATLAKELV